EMRKRNGEGIYHWYESNSRPVKNDAGEVEHVVTVARNITERKEVEETLRKHDRFLEITRETMVDGLMVINEKGIVLSINKACANIFGYSEKEIVGNNVNMLMNRHDNKHHDGHIAHHLKTGEAKIIGIGPREITGKKKDGSEVALELAVNSHEEEGSETIFVASLRDITQRKDAEATFLELQEKLRLITENANDIISLRDSSGKMIYLSPSFERQLKYDPKDYMEEAAWKTVMHPDDRETFMKDWKKTVFEKGLPYTSEHRLKTAEGDYLWFESQSRPVKNEAGEVTACVSISRNISEQRKMQEQLRQAKKMEAIGQLTGGVAHEFNNILTTILGSLRIFEAIEMDEETRECLKYTIEASKKGAMLTEQLLKFSRKEKLAPETLNLNDFFRDINPMLEITVGKNIAYKFQPARKNIFIHVDRHELEDALLGLFNNAKEATERAGGTVKVEVSPAEITKGSRDNNNVLPGDYCLITVSDTGSGMSEDVLEKALDPFFTTKAVGEGAGLGLSSVYGFIQQSKGFLKIDSKPGLGTSVHMYFPVVKEKPKTEPADAAKPQKEKSSSATILFVESDDKKILLATKALGPIAGAVLTARSLAEASKIIKGQLDISLLITQMTMDGEDAGPELVREFRSKFKKGRILLVASHPDKAQALIKKSSRIGDVLASPYSLSSLIIKTDNLLKTLTL
ncbi:MAG: PAS domain S-box protein, partial [Proteobacteria bacterium]|nr:PAS domain S-box protein [Pseudomonadota bacterium]